MSRAVRRPPPEVIWPCAVIALIPVAVWLLSPPPPQVIWQHAGGLHYQVRITPEKDEACLILKFRDITPALEPHTCWE